MIETEALGFIIERKVKYYVQNEWMYSSNDHTF